MQLSRGAAAVGGLSVGRGGQAAALAGAAMLDQDVCALLAAGPASIGQGGQAPGVPAPHVHPILQKKAHAHSRHDRAGGAGSRGERGGGVRRAGVERVSARREPRLTQMSSCVKTTLAMALDRCRAVRPSPSP